MNQQIYMHDIYSEEDQLDMDLVSCMERVYFPTIEAFECNKESGNDNEDVKVNKNLESMHDMIIIELVTLMQMLENYDDDDKADFLRQVTGRLMKRLINQIPAYSPKDKGTKQHSNKLSVQLWNLERLLKEQGQRKMTFEKSRVYDFDQNEGKLHNVSEICTKIGEYILDRDVYVKIQKQKAEEQNN